MHRRVFGARRQSCVGAAFLGLGLGLVLLPPAPAAAASVVASFDQDASSLSLALQRERRHTLAVPELHLGGTDRLDDPRRHARAAVGHRGHHHRKGSGRQRYLALAD